MKEIPKIHLPVEQFVFQLLIAEVVQCCKGIVLWVGGKGCKGCMGL